MREIILSILIVLTFLCASAMSESTNIGDYDKAVSQKPNDPEVYLDRGLVYSYMREHEKAIKDFTEAIRLKPDHAAAYGNRGATYLAQGNMNSGCPDVKKACDLGKCKWQKLAQGKGLCK
jgi:tetratricopeptide (TPR) repeat protein